MEITVRQKPGIDEVVGGGFMLQAVFNKLFACVHRRTTFPRTRARTPAGTLPRTYVVCLDCGSEIPYDWGRMRVCPPAALAPGTKGRPRRGPAGRAQRAPEAVPAKVPPGAGPAVCVEPLLTLPVAGVDAKATPGTGGAGGLAAGEPERSSSPAEESDASPLPSKDSLCGAGAVACQVVFSQLPAPHVQPIAQPGAALPPTPVPCPYLFAASQGEGARAPNGAHTTAEGAVRRYLDRAGLRFRKVRVALRVLNSLMAGASVQPDDVAQLVSWADPGSRGRPAGELARQVVEWAGPC